MNCLASSSGFMRSSTYDWARYRAAILKPPTAQTPTYAYSVATFCDGIERITIDDAEVMISYDVASLYTKGPKQQARKVTAEIGWPYTQRTIKQFISNKGLSAVENVGPKAHLELSPTSTALVPYVQEKSKATRRPLNGEATRVHYLTKIMTHILSPVKAHTATLLLIAHIYSIVTIHLRNLISN